MSFLSDISKIYDDKEVEKTLRKRIFLGFLIITIVISSLFVIEGYDSAVDFGKQAEGSQLHENAEHVVETLEAIKPLSNEATSEHINIADHLHTKNEAAVIYMLNGEEVISSSDFEEDHLRKIISLIKTQDVDHNYITSHGEMCDNEYCMVECDGEEYNWMIHHSVKYGDILVIQKYNLKNLAKEYVIPRMLTSAFVVIWLGIWSSFGIALVLSKLITKYQKSLKFHVLYDRITKLPNEKNLIDKLYNINDFNDEVRQYCLAFVSVDNINSLQFLHGIELREITVSKIADIFQSNINDCTIGAYNRDIFYFLFIYDDFKIKEIKDFLYHFPRETVNVGRVKFAPVFSLGINQFSDDFYSPNEIINGAFYALTKAQTSRHKTVTYTDLDDKSIHLNSELNQDLDEAIDNEEFILYYQPKVSLTTKEIVGVEALVRWNHPKKGILYPDQFIHLIETSSIAKKFSINIVDMALHQINKWSEQGLNIKVAINVSPYDLADETFSNYLVSLFKNGSLINNQIEIELTEIENTVDIKHLSKILFVLKNIGVNCSIDDFGTGMGSLTYLKDIPVHAVKIDKSFVMDMDVNATSEAITESTIKLASKLGCLVIAEGIENKYIEEMLSGIKCDIAQGYHYSKPVPGDDLMKFVLKYNEEKEQDIKLSLID